MSMHDPRRPPDRIYHHQPEPEGVWWVPWMFIGLGFVLALVLMFALMTDAGGLVSGLARELSAQTSPPVAAPAAPAARPSGRDLARPGPTSPPAAAPATDAYYAGIYWVGQQLKAPSQATYSRLGADPQAGYRVLAGGRIEAWGFVDSPNPMGVRIRNTWRVVVERLPSGDWYLHYGQVEGVRVGDYVQAIGGR